ncbi:MAG: hypothetical protein R2795_01595 [Saprospiraceae bacterium]
MTNIDMPNIEEYVDVDAIGQYKRACSQWGRPVALWKYLNFSSCENGRTPMQWNDTPNAGFSTGTPWKRVNDNYS